MLKQAITFSLFLAVILVPKTLGKQDGAPAGACESLTPQHYGGQIQTTPSPYSISLAVSEYTPGTKVAVTINGGEFKGILLQARKSDGSDATPIGTFSDVPTDTKTTECTAADDSFTHANKNAKNGITVQWNPPSEAAGEVKFYATVVQSFKVYWVKIESSALSVQAGGASNVTGSPDGGSTNAPSDSPNPTDGDESNTGITQTSVTLLTVFILTLAAVVWKLF